MVDALTIALCPKLCRHNLSDPTAKREKTTTVAKQYKHATGAKCGKKKQLVPSAEKKITTTTHAKGEKKN